jgi:hypothetical protein
MRNRIRSTLLVSVALTAILSVIGVSSALATPKGEYAVFAQCPLSNHSLTGCLVSRTESGEITIGKQEVPIVKTQTLQGGLIEKGSAVQEIVEAANKETFTKTPQKVPGGITGFVKCNEIKGEGFWEKLERGTCEFFFEGAFTGVNATTELAAPASSIYLNELALEFETGPGLILPVKVKLENPLLGNECYIGSNSEPIKLELTTGTSGSLKGKFGETSEGAEGGILVVTNSKLVDSGFAAPKATGCGEGLSWLLDPILNAKLGLPASTGDTAVLNTTLEQANAALVRESEEA